MHLPTPVSQPSEGTFVPGGGQPSPGHTCDGLAANNWPGLAWVELFAHSEVMAARSAVRKVALFAQKILTSSPCCSNAWPRGPLVAWHWLPSPTMAILCPSFPFFQASEGLFSFCRVPAKHSFLIQEGGNRPQQARERSGVSKHICLSLSSSKSAQSI